jgi:hypothetical protein
VFNYSVFLEVRLPHSLTLVRNDGFRRFFNTLINNKIRHCEEAQMADVAISSFIIILLLNTLDNPYNTIKAQFTENFIKKQNLIYNLHVNVILITVVT